MDAEQQQALWGAIKTLQEDLAATRKTLREDLGAIKASTDGIVEAFNAAKGAFKVLGWLGTVAKWVGAISAGFAGVYGAYAAWKMGISPK